MMYIFMQELQRLNERRVEVTRAVLLDYLALEKRAIDEQLGQLAEVQTQVDAVDAKVDMGLFVRAHRQQWTEPYDFAFEPRHVALLYISVKLVAISHF